MFLLILALIVVAGAVSAAGARSWLLVIAGVCVAVVLRIGGSKR